MNAFVIDDEKNAREVIIDKIEEHCKSVTIVGQSGSPLEAIKKINQLKPDILFLDISMPEMNGFQLVDKIQPFEGEIIFVTAYDNFAIQAFKTCAIGYLLKPIDTQQLINTVALCKKLTHQPSLDPSLERFQQLTAIEKGQPAKLAIPTAQGYSFIGLEEIIRLEADQKYTYIFSASGKILSSKNLGYFSDILLDKGFVITHKSHILNLNFIDSFDKDGIITLKDSSTVPLSRRRKKDFLKSFIR